MLSSILRLASYHTAAIGDPKQFLREFEAAIDRIRIPESEVQEAEDFYRESERNRNLSSAEWQAFRQEVQTNPALKQKESAALRTSIQASAIVGGLGYRATEDPGHKLFLTLLQMYTLPPAIRKKVEVAVKLYMNFKKPRTPKKGDLYAAKVEMYRGYITTLDSHVRLAKEAIQKGTPHSEEGGSSSPVAPTRIKVGPFTLVNTGGFPESTMKEVAEVVSKATSLLQSHGFGSVCYGDIQVTNTISRSNVAAFYLKAQDDLFIRANIKANANTLRTVLHELGHRHDMKFLRNDAGVAALYQAMRKGVKEDLPRPTRGDKVTHNGKTYSVLHLEAGRQGLNVKLSVDGTDRTATVSLKTFWDIKNSADGDITVSPGGFVTEYAKKHPIENYAEMFAFYCLGQLSDTQKKAFEDLVK